MLRLITPKAIAMERENTAMAVSFQCLRRMRRDRRTEIIVRFAMSVHCGTLDANPETTFLRSASRIDEALADRSSSYCRVRRTACGVSGTGAVGQFDAEASA